MPRPLVILVGGDTLALEVCRAFVESHDVRFLWHADGIVRARVEQAGAVYVAAPPDEPESLALAGIQDAVAVVAVDADDRLNLEVALNARALSRNVRIVLSQFSRGLGNNVQRNIPNCSVISPAAHSAATFAAAAVDPRCFYGLEFPEGSGGLVAFVACEAGDVGDGGATLAELEGRVGGKILACDGHLVDDAARVPGSEERLVAFRVVGRADAASAGIRHAPRFWWQILDPLVTLLRELDPLVRATLVAGVLIFFAASFYFAAALKLDWLTAVYFVAETLTTVGYGDISVLKQPDAVKAFAVVVMFAGIVVTNLTVAFLSAALVRAQWIALQGLRRVHASGHVVVCGAGRVGTRVVEYLRRVGLPLVIVERQPSATAVRFGRERRIWLLTGDAVEDETLDLCDVERARSVVVLTDSDAANLEVALGVRARQAEIPVVMRVSGAHFAKRTKAQFEISSAFSPVALCAPVVVGLAGAPGVRGRLALGARRFSIEESSESTPAPRDAIVLATLGGRVLRLVPAG